MPQTDDVEVRQNDTDAAGRGLFARKDFKPGELILAVDRPLVAELDSSRQADTCAWCFTRAEQDPGLREGREMLSPSATISVKACTGCRRMKYCSRSCQSRAWKREHKYECVAISPTNRPDLPHGVRAVIKLLGRLKADPKGNDEAILEILKFRPVAGGEGVNRFRDADPEVFQDYQAMAYGAWKYAGEPTFGSNDPIDTARGWFFNITMNALTLSSPFDDYHLGIAFDDWICSANHSCEPNCAVVFNQPQTTLRALEHIREGEEIFVKYCDTTNPRSVRQEELRQKYYFECECSKCSSSTDGSEEKFAKTPEQLPNRLVPRADELLKKWEARPRDFLKFSFGESIAERRLAAMQAEAFSVSGISFHDGQANDSSSISGVLDALKLLLDSGMWTYARQPVPHLVRQLMTLYMQAGDVYRAFRVGAKLSLVINPMVHPQPFYPDRIVDEWMMQTLVNQLCSPSNQNLYDEFTSSGLDLRLVFFGYLINVHDQVDKMYGVGSPFGKVVNNIYSQLEKGSSLSMKEIRQQVATEWPKLEHYATDVDILTL